MTSNEIFKKAQSITPGGVHSPVRSLSSVGVPPVFFQSGEGAYLTDVEGKQYIDFCQSFGPHILGHAPEALKAAVVSQVEKGTSFGACHPGEVALSERILKQFPFLDKVRLVNSGTEAVMTAIRIARGATGRSKIVKFDGCYHGHSDGLMAKAGSGVAGLSESSSKGIPDGLVQETIITRFDDLEAIQETFSKFGNEIAAVVMEPIPANCGLWVPEKEHLHAIARMAKDAGALTIFDEVITGFRVGPSGVAGLFDMQPDLVTLGKIIGGGLPLAAVAGKASAMNCLAPLGEVYQAGTLSGNPLATAAGCAVLDELEKNPPYEDLDKATVEFTNDLKTVLERRYEVDLKQHGSIFWFRLCEAKDTQFPPTVSEENIQNYGELFQSGLREGLYLPPSPYEVAFVSTAHIGAPLTEALEKLERCLK